MEGTYSAE
jgi:prepilin-type processing-associated H-X9-DG protein